MSLKQATEELLKIADEIEKDAAEVTQFVCAKCNHTATLASINMKRREAADENAKAMNSKVTVAEVTVNDKVYCPACDGVMAYQETEASAPYYFDPEKQAKAPHDESKETPAQEKAETPEMQQKEKEEGTEQHPVRASTPIDYDSLKRYASK